MSSLWTPGGERPVPRSSPPEGPGDPGGPGHPGGLAGSGAGYGGDEGGELTEAEMAAQLAQMRDQLAATPASAVVANHAYGLFELAALHLSLEPPQLGEARLAIDALGALVEGLGDRLGEHASELGAGLAQLRMAFVQIQGALGQQPPAE